MLCLCKDCMEEVRKIGDKFETLLDEGDFLIDHEISALILLAASYINIFSDTPEEQKAYIREAVKMLKQVATDERIKPAFMMANMETVGNA